MGYIMDHTIVVVGGEKALRRARHAAIDAGCIVVSKVTGPGSNSTYSLLIGTDGSKEGWETSNEGDEARDKFVKWLKRNNTIDTWYEVEFPEDSGPRITRSARNGELHYD